MNRRNISTLNDQTPISTTTWEILKKSAMEKNYKSERWYEDLTIIQKQLLEKLIET